MAYDLIRSNDLIDNPTPRCACLLVLDTSGSMAGAAIDELNAGVQLFIETVHADEVAACSVEIAVVTAGGSVRQVLPFTSALHLESCAPMHASGTTPLGQAVEQGLDLLEQRKAEYRKNGVAYYQPWLVIISDGSPTDSWQAAAQRARELGHNRKLVSLAIGVSGADLGTLGQFSNRPAVALQGLKFRDFFLWLSASMSRVSQSASTTSGVTLPAMDGWASI